MFVFTSSLGRCAFALLLFELIDQSYPAVIRVSSENQELIPLRRVKRYHYYPTPHQIYLEERRALRNPPKSSEEYTPTDPKTVSRRRLGSISGDCDYQCNLKCVRGCVPSCYSLCWTPQKPPKNEQATIKGASKRM
ncbi:unnamed protein product [Dicrocoelium dendriticum]|nr:unnamed protein product [Dicrocoelium dendriticum]